MSDANITKNAIANGFKELCRTHSFEKISISQITNHCGLNRQTFYYHFKDKYELLEWVYYNEAFIHLIDGITLKNWNSHLQSLLEIMEEDKKFYISTVKAYPDIFTSYLFHLVETLFASAIEALDENHKIDHTNQTFYARFYAYGCCGMVTSWITDGMKTPSAKISQLLKNLAHDSEQLAYLRITNEE